MPLDEEGAKWSCEPCIRGHRSSKCQHFDRLMMKVPKAGRPLAKCPHPKGSCSCQRMYALMVRIPKGSTCLCRPLYQVPATSAEASSVPVTPGTPSVTSSASTPGRIQKQSRRQSNLQAAPNNIAKALDTELEQSGNGIYAAQALTDPNHSTNPNTTSGINIGSPDKPFMPRRNSQEHTDTPQTAQKTGGCCSGNSAPVATAPPPRSCCAGSSVAKEESDLIDKPTNPGYTLSWESSSNMEPLTWNTSFQNGHYPSQNTNFAGVNQSSSSYVSQLHSESPVYYQPNMQNQSTLGSTSMGPLLFNSTQPPFNLAPAYAGDNSHVCSCGDNCQCLGCASHPFNETTRQHVQRMGYMMSIDEDDEGQGKTTPFMGPNSPPLLTPNLSPTRAQRLHTMPTFTDNAILPSTFDNTLSSAGSFATDEFMQPSEYYTIEYPVGLSLCSNVSGTCQCGNDCSCVGCLTHSGHNGVALESPPSESQQRLPPQEVPPQRSTSEYIGRVNVPRTLDQYSPSALSPPVVESPLV